jgi:hypothetical protein
VKDLILFALGVIVGFLFGLVIYWLPLRQLRNELSSLKNLMLKKYTRGDEITVRVGVDLKPVDPNFGGPLHIYQQTEMIVAYDVGVDWYFMSTSGHHRSRVVHASLKSQPGVPFLYKVPHHWII